MNSSRQAARDLVAAYNHSLEQQIVGRGSNLACRDEELFQQVEELLRSGDAHEVHCLGLDPLRVMEESLAEAAAAAAAAPHGGRGKARGELRRLAKAFEVLEQAALNLYLGPWREEYKVVKMYSGMFTHYIKSVLSMPQIEKLFGLLGYQPSVSRQEQLRLQSPRVGPVSPDSLLRLSCGFFLARCECRLLLKALGSRAGDAEWELSVVRERQKGHGVQVALETTKKTLKDHNAVMEPVDGEVDLYTDKQDNGGQRESVVRDDESPPSSSWFPRNNASPQDLRPQSNGMTLLSTPNSLPTREQVCISTFKCQLTKTSPVESDRSCSASKRQGAFDKAEIQSQPHSLQFGAEEVYRRKTEANICRCLQFSNRHLVIKHCVECKTLHQFDCALLKGCMDKGHAVVSSDITIKELNESGAVSPQNESHGGSDTSTSQTVIGSCMDIPSLVPCDGPQSIIASLHPISYHDCCNLAQLDPQVLCVSCRVFHSRSCSERDYCSVHHTVKQLGVCTCGTVCSRAPLVLCRYCGVEYCTDCWYRNPVICLCGQTFDQSSSV
ncbi:hypothetical protein Q5P01_011932 [Channa striata]|uniref:Spermatogenesis-associated protein 2 PUB-like domain-containing protein n=1 Tax=Channa striata TaxID=64152 RepID=A0AA88SL27_CHASR|nr:hypothetical protein Q5P01_011932 [Channa striata]